MIIYLDHSFLSIERLELANFPVLETTVGEVPPDNEGDFLFAELLFRDGQWVPVH